MAISARVSQLFQTRILIATSPSQLSVYEVDDADVTFNAEESIDLGHDPCRSPLPLRMMFCWLPTAFMPPFPMPPFSTQQPLPKS